MPQSGVGGLFIDSGIQAGIDGKVQIDDGPATITDKVVMGRDVCFKAVKSASKIDLFYKPLIQKYIQVAIDRTYTEVRKLILQSGVEPVGSGMLTGFPQQLQYSVTLSAAIVFTALGYIPLLNKNSNDYYIKPNLASCQGKLNPSTPVCAAGARVAAGICRFG